MNFILEDNVKDAKQAPTDVLKYLEAEMSTKLPSKIREDEVLEFDQNFECGNLDSAYLKTDYEYDLLMKVDTNTRGNTYWFYFKVSGFMVGMLYRFNIVNFTRNVELFYSKGMNVMTRIESEEGNSDWIYDACERIDYQNTGDILRSNRKYTFIDDNGI